MGLNVLIQKLDGTRHPVWDDAKYSGDRMIFDAIQAADPEYNWLNECDWVWRPTNFEALRVFAWPDFNQDRWRTFIETLENEPEYWVYMSV